MTTPNRPPLSPAAQAVLDAVITENQTGPERFHARAHAAAALRAAADAVAVSPYTVEHAQFWSELHGIAAELEGTEQATKSTH